MNPPLETDCREQDAVFWQASGFDNYGEVSLDAAVDIKVRWENSKGSVLDAKGNDIAFDAEILVDRVMTIGSILWQGTISELPGTGTETPTSLIFKVITYTEIPDLKGRNFRRSVLVSRHSDQLPALT